MIYPAKFQINVISISNTFCIMSFQRFSLRNLQFNFFVYFSLFLFRNLLQYVFIYLQEAKAREGALELIKIVYKNLPLIGNISPGVTSSVCASFIRQYLCHLIDVDIACS